MSLPPSSILYPNVAELYRHKVENPQKTWLDSASYRALDLLRELLERVELHPLD